MQETRSGGARERETARMKNVYRQQKSSRPVSYCFLMNSKRQRLYSRKMQTSRAA